MVCAAMLACMIWQGMVQHDSGLKSTAAVHNALCNLGREAIRMMNLCVLLKRQTSSIIYICMNAYIQCNMHLWDHVNSV